MNAPVLFFRGVNTLATERLHFGPVPLWKMGRNLQKYVHRPERNFILVEDIGCSTFAEEAERAEKFITRLPFDRYHFLAHSAGGIVAKVLLNNNSALAKKTLSLTTVATPHQGSFLADLILGQPLFSYDQKRKSLLDRLTTTEVKKFSQNLSLPANVVAQSALCSCPVESFSLPIKVVTKLVKNYKVQEPSDGFVELSSQRFGHILGHYELDHLEQLGFIFRINARARRAQFRQMLESMNSSWQQIESMLG